MSTHAYLLPASVNLLICSDSTVAHPSSLYAWLPASHWAGHFFQAIATAVTLLGRLSSTRAMPVGA